MRTFQPIQLNINTLSDELDQLEGLLGGAPYLKERDQIAPFFKQRWNLCAALGMTNSSVLLPDRVATELDLFGDFACDAASGDSNQNAYTLVEFEDAHEHSVFNRLEAGKSMKRWSPRFEHGFSQLVDCAWRLSSEATSDAFARIFGQRHAHVHLLLIVGRNSTLLPDDVARLRWRANNISLGPYRMSCLTFDDVLGSIRRRLLLSQLPP